MLELMLAQYEDAFGKVFPLGDFEGEPEIDVLNILYYCVQNKIEYVKDMDVPDVVTGVPKA